MSEQDRKPAPIAVSVEEGARMCGLGRTKFYEELKRGKIRSRKAGKRRLIEVESLRAWFASLPEQTG